MSRNGSKLDGPHSVDGSQLEVGFEVRSTTPRLFRGELIRRQPPLPQVQDGAPDGIHKGACSRGQLNGDAFNGALSL